jgi:hypothetical protein
VRWGPIVYILRAGFLAGVARAPVKVMLRMVPAWRAPLAFPPEWWGGWDLPKRVGVDLLVVLWPRLAMVASTQSSLMGYRWEEGLKDTLRESRLLPGRPCRNSRTMGWCCSGHSPKSHEMQVFVLLGLLNVDSYQKVISQNQPQVLKMK